MAQGSGFYKGEKKKKKKDDGSKPFSVAPVFVAPEVTIKGKSKF